MRMRCASLIFGLGQLSVQCSQADFKGFGGFFLITGSKGENLIKVLFFFSTEKGLKRLAFGCVDWCGCRESGCTDRYILYFLGQVSLYDFVIFCEGYSWHNFPY